MRMIKNEICIDGRKIGLDGPPYIVAELSANHNGDLNRALNIIDMAKTAGADAIKLQTYSAETLTIDCDNEEFQIKGGLWDGRSLFELYQWAQMPWDWHKPLFERAKALGITIFSSPFDTTAVDLLEDLDTPAYKIASFEMIDLPLIKYVAQTGKPLVISTGMANSEEIGEAIAMAEDNGCTELVVLHCVSGYPSIASDYNLRTLSDIAKRFNVLTGLSDHTLDNVTAITSVAFGACLIEKHVTLDRSSGGPDDSFSLEAKELEQLCRDSKTAWESLGRVNYERQNNENENAKFRRSLYVVRDIKAGEVINKDNVKSIRPGFGLAPKYYEKVMGKTASVDLEFGTPLSLDDLI